MAVLLAESQRRHLEDLLGSQLRAIATVPGGDINDAYRITLADGRRLFVKMNRSAPPDLFRREAEGLAFLKAGLLGSELHVPEVVLHSSSVLVLEFLEFAAASPAVEEALGRGLARLHAATLPRFGLDQDNYIGTLVQANAALPSWAEFFGQNRLLAQARLPQADRLLDQRIRRRLDRLVARLPELLAPEQAPSRLHGDLWAGNWMSTASGPYLVDPAVYGGHPEVNLAMMALFGGFSERVFSAYRETRPLAPGHAERQDLHQLYPLLVHLNLFGAGYLAGVQRIVDQYA